MFKVRVILLQMPIVKVDGYPEQQTDTNGSTTFGQIGV
jgi:hypothetical protein